MGTMEALALPAEATSVRRAREFVGDLASSYLPDPTPAVLLTSELVTNAIRHVRTAVTVSVKPGPPFRVEVHDGVGATKMFRDLIARKPSPVPETASTGRGLHLVHELATRLGLDYDPDGGKVVWFEL